MGYVEVSLGSDGAGGIYRLPVDLVSALPLIETGKDGKKYVIERKEGTDEITARLFTRDGPRRCTQQWM